MFSNNCIGGVFLLDSGMRFDTPTVNLAMGVSFLSFLEHSQDYLKPEFEFISNENKSFPVGKYKER